MLKYILICGVSGSGKSTIEKQLSELDEGYVKFNKLRQVTTRDMREEELENPPYLFLSEEIFKSYQPHLIAQSHFQDNYYGTMDTSIDAEHVINTIIVNRMGYDNVVRDLNEKYGEENIFIKTMRVISKDLAVREGRDTESLLVEEKLLKDIADFDIVNNKDNRPLINDVVNKCINALNNQTYSD